MQDISTIKIALADDHGLLRNALAALIDNFDNCKVIYQANDGKELLDMIQQGTQPDIVLLDLNMPVMDGHETAAWLQKNMPEVRVLMLTMYDSELLLIRLLQAGVKGFLKKDIHPSELRFSIQSVMQTGYYYSNHTSGKLANLFRLGENDSLVLQKVMLNEQEMKFLELACTELTYKEMALEMKLNPRAIDNLRDHLFEKLDVKSRVGLALFAIRKGVITLQT
jgi:two-component system, NarL family, invasion response regulator UvrY